MRDFKFGIQKVIKLPIGVSIEYFHLAHLMDDYETSTLSCTLKPYISKAIALGGAEPLDLSSMPDMVLNFHYPSKSVTSRYSDEKAILKHIIATEPMFSGGTIV